MNKNTIAYIHTGLFPSKSPSITFVTYNAIAISKQFDKVYLFVKRNSNKSTQQVLKDTFQINQPDNLEIVSIPCIIFHFNLLFYLQVLIKLYSIRNELLVVISRNVTFLPYLIFVKKTFKKPVYFESHDFFTDLSLRDDKLSKRKHKNSTIEKRFMPQLSGLLCLQHAQKDLYQKYYPNLKIHVLRTGLNRIVINDTKDRRYLCYIGSFDAHKGLEQLFKAASLSEKKPIILLIGGKDDKDITNAKLLIDKYSYNDKTTITGWIDKQKMAEYLSQVKLGIVSLEDTFFNRFITSPLKIFDYYAYGIPIIATDLPTTRELVIENETGLFVSNNDCEAFSKHIDKIYKDDILYHNMVDKVYAQAKELLWDKRANMLKSILKDDK